MDPEQMNSGRTEKYNPLYHGLVCFGMILTLFASLSSAKASTTPKFSMMMYYVGLMVLDPGVSINEILNQDDYIIMKGIAPDQRTAYLLAEKLFHSRMQKEFKFEDIIPFWKTTKFTFILKKPKTKSEQLSIEIKTPPVRKSLKSNFALEGTCTKEGAKVNLSGDFQGKTICKKGSWSFELSAKDIKLPIVGVKVSQGLLGQQNEDYRSFIIRRP